MLRLTNYLETPEGVKTVYHYQHIVNDVAGDTYSVVKAGGSWLWSGLYGVSTQSITSFATAGLAKINLEEFLELTLKQ